MRELERDGEHIWLRQSVTFTVDGQTRTLEIAIPLRPGAASGEVDTLLREAQAGMARLTRDLDAQVAAIANGTPLPATSALPPTAGVPTLVEPAPSEPATPAPAGAPAPTAARPAPQPAAPPPPAPPAAPRAAPRAEPSAARARPSGPLVREAATPAAAPAGPPMDLREFLSTARGELDLTPPQIMSRLGVKSLSGINYREALENLRREALRGEEGANPPEPAPVSAPAPVARRAAPAAVPQPVRYFEEELDEPEVSFSMDGDDAGGAASGTYDEAEDFDLEGDEDEYEDLALGDDEEEVPDFGPPPTPATPAPRAADPSRPHAAGRTAAPAAPAPAQPAEDGDGGERAYAMQLVGQMRGAKPGGTPSTQQRTAFRNIVVQELGAEKAKSVVQGLYRVPLERLGPEQLDALISWGKRDTFAEDADLVLATLRAERERAANAAGAEPSSAPPAPANGAAPRTPARGRPAPRAATER